MFDPDIANHLIDELSRGRFHSKISHEDLVKQCNSAGKFGPVPPGPLDLDVEYVDAGTCFHLGTYHRRGRGENVLLANRFCEVALEAAPPIPNSERFFILPPRLRVVVGFPCWVTHPSLTAEQVKARLTDRDLGALVAVDVVPSDRNQSRNDIDAIAKYIDANTDRFGAIPTDVSGLRVEFLEWGTEYRVYRCLQGLEMVVETSSLSPEFTA